MPTWPLKWKKLSNIVYHLSDIESFVQSVSKQLSNISQMHLKAFGAAETVVVAALHCHCLLTDFEVNILTVSTER